MNRHVFHIVVSILVAGLAMAALGLLIHRPAEAQVVHLPPQTEAESTAQEPLLRPAALPYTTFVKASSFNPETLDPHWMYDTSSGEVALQVYETLLCHEREKIDVFVPLLATDWAISSDGRTYTFTIRQGVTFHAGGSLTPEDVAYSFWRGMLQNRTYGPMWMLLSPLLGVNDIDDYPEDDTAKCQAVKNAVTYDSVNRTVTFHLLSPSGPFLQILAHSSAAVLDKEWMVANGGWGGDCANWRDYHDPRGDESILFDQMNGTGPFMLSHWISDEVALVRNENYWLTQPLWDRGPAGPAELEQVLLRDVDDWTTRYDMLANGDADFAYVPAMHSAQLDPLLWTRHEGPDDATPTLVYLTGTLRLYVDLPSVSAVDAFFTFDINTDTNPYIGSGVLDGDGIPPNFFSDLHVRKAFSYAFDWATFISDAYDGEAIQHRGPIIAGVMGYDPAQPTYFYSPTLSMQELQQAWGGQVWANGFSLTLAYNMGNPMRQRACEILKQNIEAINDTFHVNIVAIDSLTYSGEVAARRIPLWVYGWSEDYHHPHSWVHPYMHSQGTWSSIQGFPITLSTQFDAKIDECNTLTKTAAAASCYAELQHMAYENAIDIFLAQPADRHYERAEVRGWYHNPAHPGSYYYAISKGPLPTPTAVETDADNTMTYPSTSGLTTTLGVPSGAVTESTVIVYTSDIPVAERPGGFQFAGRSFILEAYQGGEYVPGFTFGEPVTITIHYSDEDIAQIVGDTLVLYTWDGNAWVNAACGPYQRDPVHYIVRVPICHLSDFALFGEPKKHIYLPLVLKEFSQRP